MNTNFKIRTARFLGTLLLGLASLGFVNDSTYESEIKEWHKQRVESLKTENGWLNLAGLFWLEDGRNSFGADGKNKIVFPSDRVLRIWGPLLWKTDRLHWKQNRKLKSTIMTS